jgi:hypothetical protein
MGYVFVRTCKLAAIVRPANGCTLIIKKRKKKGGPQSRKERQISRFRGLESNDVDGEAAVKMPRSANYNNSIKMSAS